jgi:hypothetical protein
MPSPRGDDGVVVILDAHLARVAHVVGIDLEQAMPRP